MKYSTKFELHQSPAPVALCLVHSAAGGTSLILFKTSAHLQNALPAANGRARVAQVDPFAGDIAPAPLDHAAELPIFHLYLQAVQVLLELLLSL